MNDEAKTSPRVDAVFQEARTILDSLSTDEAAIAKAKRGVFEERSTARPWAWIAVGTSLAAVAVVLVLVLPRSQPALTFAVDETPSQPGTWLATDASERTLRFDDASEIVLAPESDATVASTTSHGARVLLTRGRLQARITHRADTEWKLEAGPFHIRVIGTSFETEWSPDDAYFELRVTEGVVEVEGPTLDARRVRAGSAVRVWVREDRARTDESPTEATSAGEPMTSSVAEAERSTLARGATELERAASSDVRSSRSANGTGTRATNGAANGAPSNEPVSLARAGRYADAIAEVRSRGIDRVLHDATPSERLELGDAARYARDAALAKRFYEGGPRSGDSGARAAFGLARVSLDLDSDRAEAIRWLRTSIRRSSRGALAREARGRLMELLHASRDPGAREAAVDYLRLHPEGPQAEAARRIVGP